MAHIKIVRVKAISFLNTPFAMGYYWQHDTFVTFTDDNNNKYYILNDNEVSKEEGNLRYLDIKDSNKKYRKTKECKDYIRMEWKEYHRCYDKDGLTLHENDTFKQEIAEYDITYEELIEKLQDSLDRYVDYIDDGKQYQDALARNRKISERIEKLLKLIALR